MAGSHDLRRKKHQRRLAVALAIWGALVVGTTLAPVDGGSTTASACLFCGARGLADAALNVVMFAPFGLWLGVRFGIGPLAAVLAGALVSAGIEATQIAVPGRSATLGDIVWNAVGALLGVALLGLLRRTTMPESTNHAVGAAAAFTAWVLFAGALTIPQGTDSQYFGMWTPALDYMPQYQGSVRSAELDGNLIPRGGPLPDASAIPRALLGTWSLEATVVVGPAPPAVAAIVAIYDGDQREIALLGADGNDLVWRERLLADRMKMDKPDVRFSGALTPFTEGTEVTLSVRRAGTVRCLAVDAVERCSPSATIDRSWAFLRWVGGSSAWHDALDVLWLLALSLPIGFLSRTIGQTCAAGSLATAAVLVAVVLTPLGPPGPLEVLGGVAGVATGRWIRWMALRNHDAWSPSTASR